MPRFLNSPYFLLISSSLIWGATVPIMKFTLTQVPVFSLAFIRMFLASLILFLVVRKNFHIEKKDIIRFFLAAIFGVTLNLVLFFAGLKITNAIDASLLIASVPILTLLAAHIYLKEKLSTRLTFSAIVAILGVTIIIGKPDGGFTVKRLVGSLMLILSSLSWVTHEILAKKLLKNYANHIVTYYTMALGAVTLLPFALFDLIKNPGWVTSVNFQGLAGLIYGIFFASLIAYWAWQKALSKLAVGEASFFFYIDPISGAIFSVILLGEKITQNLVIGGILITIGVGLAEYHRKSHPLHRN